MRGRIVEIFSDSRLVVGQVKGELEAKDMTSYPKRRKRLIKCEKKLLNSGYSRIKIFAIHSS